MGGQGLLEWGANLILDMAKLFEATRSLNGTFDVRFHDVKGIQLNSLGANDRDGSLTALDAVEAAEIAMRGAESKGCGLDRWSFYVEGDSQAFVAKLTKGLDPVKDKTKIKAILDANPQLPANIFAKRLDEGWNLFVEAAKYGKARMTLRDPNSVTKKRGSKFEILS